jgi:mono/diheme cytochrome c family protein
MTLLIPLFFACTLPGPADGAPPGATPAADASADARLARGRAVYAVHCTSCHGPEGRGDGPAAGALDPRPADLRGPRADHLKGIPRRSILENGREGTAMIGFAEVLSPEDLEAVYTLVHHWHHGPDGRNGPRRRRGGGPGARGAGGGPRD